MTPPSGTRAAMAAISAELGRQRFTAADEAALQEQVAGVLAGKFAVSREVLAAGGRYDVRVDVALDAAGAVCPPDAAAETRRIVLELKLGAQAAAVERQAQRYAAAEDVDAVVVVTTSARLGRQLVMAGAVELGGKPFGVLTLRCSF